MRRWLWVPFLLLSGCGEAPPGPVAISFGEDACSTCRMIISEPASAAEARFDSGDAELFDDIGCLLDRWSTDQTPVEAWVVDGASGAWTDARRAWYVRAATGTTPMGSGISAWRSRDDAESAAQRRQGVLLSFEEARSLPRQR